MEKKQIILPVKKFANADEQELEIKLNLDSDESLMRIGDRDIILDIDELFIRERNESVNYKIYGKLKMVFRNLYSGSTDYSYLKERLALIGDGSNLDDNTVFDGYLPYDEFAFLRRDVYREVNLPVAGDTLGTFEPNIKKYLGMKEYTGATFHTSTAVTPIVAPYHNWNLYLSYVYSADTSYPMMYTLTGGTELPFTSGDGIPFRVSYSGGSYYELTSPVEHGMSEGEHVVLTGITLTGLTLTGRTFYINSVGNETYNSDKYVINISKSQIKTGTTFSTVMLGKRCKDFNNITGSTSQYYVHKHKTLTNTGGYIMDSLGFETPIWEDEKKLVFENSVGDNDVLVERNRMESVLYDFKEPLKLSGLTNNLGFSPTEVYVSMIFRNGNGYFNYPPKVGYKFNFHDSWIDKHFSGTTSIEKGMTGYTSTFPGIKTGYTFTGGTELPIGTILTGAYIEYNPKELQERFISESYHKITNPTTIFNHGQNSGSTYASSTNPEGIIYQPHYRIKLRELSPYIESAKTNNVFDLPENTKYDSTDDVWRWRDLYDHGYIDPDGYGTDFPFINGNHYVKSEINLYLRNERFYQNKSDGITRFNDINNKNNNNNLDC